MYNAEVLESNLCDYNDAYILVKEDTAKRGHEVTQVVFITKIDGTTVEDAEDLDLVIPMYNLIEYGSNYSETTEILWFYSKDKASNFNSDIANDNNFKSFKCHAKLFEKTEVDGANGILKKIGAIHVFMEQMMCLSNI